MVIIWQVCPQQIMDGKSSEKSVLFSGPKWNLKTKTFVLKSKTLKLNTKTFKSHYQTWFLIFTNFKVADLTILTKTRLFFTYSIKTTLNAYCREEYSTYKTGAEIHKFQGSEPPTLTGQHTNHCTTSHPFWTHVNMEYAQVKLYK